MTDLTLSSSGSPVEITTRKELFSLSGPHLLRATLNDLASTTTSDLEIYFLYEDACQTAIILPQTLEDFTIKWRAETELTISIPAFTDSVDALGILPYGICGTKVLILNLENPSFLTLSQDESQDPVYAPYLLTYSESLASEADIKEHTINYTVTIADDYNGIISDLQGNFTFEIIFLPDETEYSTLQELKISRKAPISLNAIASSYLTYFNETSELVLNFVDPMLI